VHLFPSLCLLSADLPHAVALLVASRRLIFSFSARFGELHDPCLIAVVMALSFSILVGKSVL
jgi:hypothetical protein